jgi:multisubunit Na+/H+ antiporter MnhG subunit
MPGARDHLLPHTGDVITALELLLLVVGAALLLITSIGVTRVNPGRLVPLIGRPDATPAQTKFLAASGVILGILGVASLRDHYGWWVYPAWVVAVAVALFTPTVIHNRGLR